MDNYIFDNKKQVKTLSGHTILELLGRSVKLKQLCNNDGAIYYIFPDQQERIDHILWQKYGEFSKPASFLYYNNLYNPFSFEEGDLVVIPSVLTRNEYYTSPKVYTRPSGEQVKAGNRDKIDIAAKKLGDKIKTGLAVRGVLPSNRLSEGQVSKVSNGNVLVLGANIL